MCKYFLLSIELKIILIRLEEKLFDWYWFQKQSCVLSEKGPPWLCVLWCLSLCYHPHNDHCHHYSWADNDAIKTLNDARDDVMCPVIECVSSFHHFSRLINRCDNASRHEFIIGQCILCSICSIYQPSVQQPSNITMSINPAQSDSGCHYPLLITTTANHQHYNITHLVLGNDHNLITLIPSH